eukprot:TRINITY_DN65379_c0_g1_i1.p1 TRINITY_DN65379_c0_g1~~TRINITY_DN65379_c0_g1_i1.p1  ORF type:complete len:267 (+),score=61.81 TRINITY_DN65379_c0_g1_i1:87-887(+)
MGGMFSSLWGRCGDAVTVVTGKASCSFPMQLEQASTAGMVLDRIQARLAAERPGVTALRLLTASGVSLDPGDTVPGGEALIAECSEVRWQRETAGGTWVDYPPEAADQIEQAFRGGRDSVSVPVDGKAVSVHFGPRSEIDSDQDLHAVRRQLRGAQGIRKEPRIGSMLINVATLTNKTMRLGVAKETTIREVKELIQAIDTKETPVEQQVVVHAGKVLADEGSIQSYHLQDGATLHMIFRKRHGSPAAAPPLDSTSDWVESWPRGD